MNLITGVNRLHDHLGPEVSARRADDRRRVPFSTWGTRMRIRATVAAVSGALALSALAVPAAQADVHASGGSTPHYRANIAKLLGGGKTAFITSPVEGGEPYKLNVTSPTSRSPSRSPSAPPATSSCRSPTS